MTARTVQPVRVAALDLGSNSFHLLVADARPDGSFVPVLREKEMLRLGDAVAREGQLSEGTAEQAVEAVRRFRVLAESAGADEIVACATSAIREADNGAELVERFASEAGLTVRVISGLEEAALIFRAVQASVLIDPGPAVCLDLGGGSLEVMVGDTTTLKWAASVKLGVARLTAELVQTDPPKPSELRRVRQRVMEVLGPLAERAAPFKPRLLVGTSGTLCDLARMATAADTGNVPISVNQLHAKRTALEAVHEKLVNLPVSERRRLPGLESRRAELVAAGSVLALTALDLFGFDEMVVGSWALREGMVLEAIARTAGAALTDQPRLLRAASVLDLCQRCSWREAHSRHVARLATTLFDRTQSLHGLSADHRELLEHAALLHDIGDHVDGQAHHKHTAYLIQHGRLRGFSPQEVAVLSTLGRYHRQGEPKASFEPFGAMDEDTKHSTRVLTALLQVADGLDRAHASAVEDVDVEIAPGTVELRLRARTDADLERWGALRKRALFEQVFERRLDVSVIETQSAAAGWSEPLGA